LNGQKLKQASGAFADTDQAKLPARNRNAGYADLIGKLLLSEFKPHPDRPYFAAGHVT
jgi:hypothetical protein